VPSSNRPTTCSGIGAQSEARMKSRIDDPVQRASTFWALAPVTMSWT
jgi:hypothetical protein